MPPERIFLYLATLFSFGAFAVAFLSLRSGQHRPGRWVIAFLGASFLFQCAFQFLRGQAAGRCPVNNTYELLLFVAWAITLLYFLIGNAYRWSLVGLFTAPMVFFFQVGAILMGDPGVKYGKSAFWNELHKSVALMSYGAFALAAVAGVMFLVQDHQLKKHHLRGFLFHLPPIHNLTKVIRRLLILGFILLTVGILSAYQVERPPDSHGLVLIWLIWGVYAAILIYEATRGMSAKKAAFAAVGGFLLPLATLWVLSKH